VSDTVAVSAWEELAIDSELISTQSGFAFALRNTVPEGIPHLRPFNIGVNGELDLTKVIFISKDSVSNLQQYRLQPGDILFNNTNSVELVGKSTMINSSMECTFSNHLTRLRIRNANLLDPAWLALYLRIFWRNGFFAAHCHKWIGQAGFNASELANLKIPIPPLKTQQRIIARVESLLADLRKAQSTLKNMRQDIDQVMDSALLEVFGHTRDGFKVVNIPSDEVKQLNSVAKVERGKFTHRPRNDPRFFGGVIPWIQIQNLPGDYSKYITDYMNTLNNLGLSVSKLFPRGTLVLSIAATIGAVGILTFDACFPDSLVGITPNLESIDPGFLYWHLVFIREYLEKIAPSAAQKNINLGILDRIELWVPPETEQRLINVHLDAVQDGISHLQNMAKEDEEILQQLEQGFLNQAFRGEL
jgi:type I restriction enzyme S subunit